MPWNIFGMFALMIYIIRHELANQHITLLDILGRSPNIQCISTGSC